jgi:hypothetical protein
LEKVHHERGVYYGRDEKGNPQIASECTESIGHLLDIAGGRFLRSHSDEGGEQRQRIRV